jgi:thiol-disulfide isomerase/thioredoxin
MRFTLSALLAAALGFAPALALDDPKKPDGPKQEGKKDGEGATPETRFAALRKEYGELVTQFNKDMQAAKTDAERKKFDAAFQPKHEKLAARFLALGKDNLKAEFAFTALMMATQDTTTDQEAVELAVEHFADDAKILQLVPTLSYRPDGEKVLARLADSKSKEVRGGVRFLALTGELERAEGPGVKAADREKVFADAPARLAALVKEYGDVTVTGAEGPVKLEEAAKGVAYLLEHLSVGTKLEDVDCPVLDGETKGRVSDYRGKVVVLDIWATWCPPCKAMIPHERELVKKLAGKPFALVSVSADDAKEDLTRFLAKTDMPWTHWHAGPQGELLKKYQVRFFPTVYVLDAKGVIRYKNVRDKELEAAVGELLKEAEKGEKK